MISFQSYCSITKFFQKECFALHASSTLIPTLLRGDLISIPYFFILSPILFQKECFTLHASSTLIPTLLRGDLISIPYFSWVVRFVTIPFRFAANKGLSLDCKCPTSSTLTVIPSCSISIDIVNPHLSLAYHVLPL